MESSAAATTADKAAKSGNPAKPPAQRLHPQYRLMVHEVLEKCNQRTGASLQGICRHILSTYPSANTPAFRFHVRSTIARGLASGVIKRTKKTQDARGIQGRFLLDKTKKIVDKARAKKRASSASPDRPKVKKDAVKKSTVKGAPKVKAAAKVAKPRARSTSPEKGKAKIKTKAAELKGKAKPKTAAPKSKPAASPKKTATKKTTSKKAIGETAAQKKAAPQVKTAPKEKTTPKTKLTPKKPVKKTKA